VNSNRGLSSVHGSLSPATSSLLTVTCVLSPRAELSSFTVVLRLLLRLHSTSLPYISLPHISLQLHVRLSMSSSTADSQDKRAARGRPQLDIGVVASSNAGHQATGADEVAHQSDLQLKQKRIANAKRKTMPEKLNLNSAQLKDDAKQPHTEQEEENDASKQTH
jgi:hypothetical protein